MKRIVVPYGAVKQLQEELEASRVTVINALRCKTNSEKAAKIRQRALQIGGVVMEG